MHRFGFFWLCILAALVLAMALAAIKFASPARAHSWYEQTCCGTSDCRPVDDGHVVERADGVHVKGWGVMHSTDPRLRWSRDDRDHVCERAAFPTKLLCVYRKPNGM